MNAIAGKLFGTIVRPGQTGAVQLPKSSITARRVVTGPATKAYYGSIA